MTRAASWVRRVLVVVALLAGCLSLLSIATPFSAAPRVANQVASGISYVYGGSAQPSSTRAALTSVSSSRGDEADAASVQRWAPSVATAGVAAETGAGVGARDAAVEAMTQGQRFVRIGAKPQNLKWTFEHPGGTAPGTYAVPEEYFNSISHDPAFLKDIFDLPDSSLPQYFWVLEPPPGTPIQYGTVPGGEFGGSGGAPEVFFPKGY